MMIMIIDFDETTTTQFQQNDEVKNICNICLREIFVNACVHALCVFLYAKCGRNIRTHLNRDNLNMIFIIIIQIYLYTSFRKR